jgi:predicted nucleic acid-binding protein
VAVTLVDSNIILDIVTEDDEWLERSAGALEESAEGGALAINPIIYAEVSVRFETIEALEAALPRDYFRRESLPWEAAFLAAKAFVRYRRAGGVRPSPLPDFLIGAHAAVAGMTLLTRDARRYRTYFPKLRIISP